MKRSHMKEITMEVTVGAFIFMILLALGFFTIIFSYENIFAPTHSVAVKFDHVRGLRQGDNVFIRGVQVGRVRSMEIMEDGVRVHATLDYPPNLREDYRVEILPSSLLGGQYISLYEGSPEALSISYDQMLYGATPVDIMEETTATIKTLRESLVEGGILENLESTMLRLSRITEDIEAGRGSLGKIMADETLYENIQKVTENLNNITSMMERGEGTLGRLMTDETVYNNLLEISDNISLISRRITAGEGTMGRLFAEDDTLYEDLVESAAAIRKITTQLAEGEGTIGRLFTDEELYEEAKLLISEIRATIDDFRETAPLTTFTSVFFGAF